MASVSVACTITGPIALGSMCRSTTAGRFTPSAVAATTWSLCRWASIEPRSSRAKIGTPTIATAMITVVCDGLAASAATEIASSRLGIASSTSVTRISTVSTQPPNAPATVPITTPTASPISVASTPTSSVCCEARIIREKKSRPSWSLPSGKPSCGPGIEPGRRSSCSCGNASVGAVRGEQRREHGDHDERPRRSPRR